jgi:Ufm1-specific protease 2
MQSNHLVLKERRYTFAGIEERFSSLIASTAAKLRERYVSYLVEGPAISPDESDRSIVLHCDDMSSVLHLPHTGSTKRCTPNVVPCSDFFSAKRCNLSLTREVSSDSTKLIA